MIAGGLNERFSGGAFGFGSYLAEDAAKSDQYTFSVDSPDRSFGDYPELHQRLYERDFLHPGSTDDGDGVLGSVHYFFLCRVTMGVFVRSLDGRTSLDDPGERIFQRGSDKRELSSIPGLGAAQSHHA